LGSIWILGTGSYGVLSWPESHAALQRDFDEGTRGCARYAGKARQDRCRELFQLIYKGERNTAIFTRGVISVGPPVLGFAIWLAWSMLARRAAAPVPSRRARPAVPPQEKP